MRLAPASAARAHVARPAEAVLVLLPLVARARAKAGWVAGRTVTRVEAAPVVHEKESLAG